MSDFEQRIRNAKLRGKIKTAEEAAALIKPGMMIGTSGFTPSGYPKAVPLALAERAKLEGPIPVTIWTGASVGPELDDALADTRCLVRRYPYQTGKGVNAGINEGRIAFADYHLSLNSQNLRYGFYGDMDLAIIEAAAITENGGIIPTTSVGNSPTFVKCAKQVIVEICTEQPLELEGIHDIYIPQDPPHRREIPVYTPRDRIGTPYIECDPDKIVAIVHSNITDKQRPLGEIDDESRKMAGNLLDFLHGEVKAGRLPKNLLPLQSGVGSVANAVLNGLLQWPADDLTVYTEVVQDSVFDLFDSGKVSFASTTALTPSPEGAKRMYAKIGEYKNKLLLRPQEISNHPEVIRRLGLISMNTAVEVDIYGQANSTLTGGTRMINGLGGSGDFARAAFLTIFLCPSVAKGNKISRVVPMCAHVDHTEHDIDVIVTENGVADLRGCSPRERSKIMIEKCAHDDYKGILRDYAKRAEQTRGGHEPHIIEEAFFLHGRLCNKGSMLEE